MTTTTERSAARLRPGSFLLAAALPASLTLAVAALCPSAARAEIEVHVVNCTTAGLHAEAFNGKDASQTIPASSKEFHEGNPGEAHLLRCEGKGKGYCKLELKGTGDSGVRDRECPWSAREKWSWRKERLEKDHHLYVIGFQIDPDESAYCRPSIVVLNGGVPCDDPNVLGEDFQPD